MDGDRFDELTRVLTRMASRRSALRGVVAGALGLAGATATREASAQNADCAAFCRTVFDPGPARGQCVNEASNGTGLCLECAADPNAICTAEDGTVRCAGSCPEGQPLDPDTCECEVCVPPICTSETCGQQLANPCGEDIQCDPCPTTCNFGCTPLNEQCDNGEPCCSGFCGDDGFCSLGETDCLGRGEPCDGDDGLSCCTRTTCVDGCCDCTEQGGDCVNDTTCCIGTFCGVDTCCKEVDQSCNENSECCSGRCEQEDGDLQCMPGGFGDPCRGRGDCVSQNCNDDFVCDCSDSFCYTDADCCSPRTCQQSSQGLVCL